MGYSVRIWCLLTFCFAKSSAECIPSQQQFLKYNTGSCPTGTSWNETIECCVGCKLCTAGYKKAVNCSGHCVPCQEGFFSEQYDNWKCDPCRNCTELNRVDKSPCAPGRNTRCGHCFDGYHEHPDLEQKPITTIRCLKNLRCKHVVRNATTPSVTDIRVPPTPALKKTPTKVFLPFLT